MGEDLREKGNKAFASGKFAEAIEWYTKAIDSNSPNMHLLYGNRSASLCALGKLSDAESDARKAISIQQYASGYVKLFNALTKQNKVEESCKTLVEAGKLFPKDNNINNLLMSQSQQTLEKNDLWYVESEKPAFSIQIVDNKGRGVVATRDIKQGEIIFTEYPLIICSNDIFSESPFCSHCGRKMKETFPCPSEDCLARYCSDKKFAWKTYHEPVCVNKPGIVQFYDALKQRVMQQKHSPYELYASYLIGLFIQLAKKCGNPSEAWVAITARFYAENYNEICQKENQQMVDCTSFLESLPQGNWSSYITKESFELLAGAAYLDSNTLIVNVGNEYEELGSGLFVMQTLLNHSCDDNVEIIASGSLRAQIEIEANRDIKKGEELCSAYNKNTESDKDDFSANMYDSTEVHQEKLRRTWGITCNCPSTSN